MVEAADTGQASTNDEDIVVRPCLRDRRHSVQCDKSNGIVMSYADAKTGPAQVFERWLSDYSMSCDLENTLPNNPK